MDTRKTRTWAEVSLGALRHNVEEMQRALPDGCGLLGVVKAQGLVQTVDDALSEDYARLAGLSAEEDLNETLVQSVRKRLPWLLVLLGLGMVVSSVVCRSQPFSASKYWSYW